MTVWVLEIGCYDNRYIHGVYASVELGMRAWQPENTKESPNLTYQWKEREDYWEFDADWSDNAVLWPYEVCEK